MLKDWQIFILGKKKKLGLYLSTSNLSQRCSVRFFGVMVTREYVASLILRLLQSLLCCNF